MFIFEFNKLDFLSLSKTILSICAFSLKYSFFNKWNIIRENDKTDF